MPYACACAAHMCCAGCAWAHARETVPCRRLREWTGDATAGALVALAALRLRTVRYGVGLRRRWTKRFGLTQVTAATVNLACNMQHAPLLVGGPRRLGLRHTRLRLPCAALCAVLHLACRTVAPSVAHRKLELAARIIASHMAPRRTPCSTRTRHCGVTSCEAHAAWRVRRVSERRG